MVEKNINFQFLARYNQLGQLNADTRNLLFVIHGYGQLSKFFLRKFSILDNGKNCIIAPEGLSRFYLEGFNGRVGATWMTKEARETDIENYINYLNSIYISLKDQIHPNTQISIVGFSQGSATASRWIASKIIPFDQLILWAGIFPPDMDFNAVSDLLSNKKITYIYGLSDPFITEERLDEMKVLSKKLKVKPEVVTFEGDHTINEEVLSNLFINNG